MESPNATDPLLEDISAEPPSFQCEGFGEIFYGVNLTETMPLMESRKSLRKYRGAYMRTRSLLTWTLFLCLILLWGFASIKFESNELAINFKWNFDDPFFGTSPTSGSLTGIIWALSVVLLFYYVKYQVVHQFKTALHITQLAIVAMVGVIFYQRTRGDAPPGEAWRIQSLVQGTYVSVMIVVVSIRLYQVNFLPVWQEKNWFLTVPVVKPLPKERVEPQLLVEFCDRFEAPLHWCAYECVGKATRFLPRIWSDHFKVMYVGEVDTENRPHGFGEWWDNHYHGEHLVGLWRQGKPIGPFKSREKGSSSGFKNFRIGYFMNRADPLDKRLCCPNFAPDGELLYGMLSVECSVSGVFFKDYPRVSFLDGPHVWHPRDPFSQRFTSFRDNNARHRSSSRTSSGLLNATNNGSKDREPGDSLDLGDDDLLEPGVAVVDRRLSDSHRSWMIQRMERSPSLRRNARTEIREDTIVVSADPNRGLVVSGYENVDTSGSKVKPATINIQLKENDDAKSTVDYHGLPAPSDWTTTSLNVTGWEPKTKFGRNEALIFIHGFNAAVSDASRIFGQFLALSNLPPYIKPITFSWPGGSEFSYVQARLNSVEAEETVTAFLEFMRFLAADGFSRIHIMTHSLGVRVLMAAVPRLAKIIPGVGPTQAGMLPLRIATVTLLSPDYELEPFREDLGHRLRCLCPLITIYGDRTDHALYIAEVANFLIDFFIVGKKDKVRRKCSTSSNSAVSGKESNGPESEGPSTSMEETLKDQGEDNRKRWRLEQVLEEYRFVFSVFGESPQRNRKFQFMKRKAVKFFRGWTSGMRLKNLGRVTDQVTDAFTGEPFDMDVIDTSFMDANVHGIRHNYFNLNRELVEDIRDLLVTQRRAHQRTSRLEWLGGNVFGFLVAPTYVVNP